MKLFNIIAALLLSLYMPLIPQDVDPAVNPHIDLMKLEAQAMTLDRIIETSYNNETAPIKAIELDFKIQEKSQHEYTDDEIKNMSYDTLLIVDKKFVIRKMKLAGKKNQKKELEKIAKAIALSHDISPNMFAALIRAESNFNIRAKSKKDATGLCQIIPENFKRLGIKDPYDPIQNMNGGAKLFKQLSKMFDGNISHVLAAYNAGPGAVQLYNGVPPYSETKEYIKKVFEHFRNYKKG